MSILSSTNSGIQYFIEKWFNEHVLTNVEWDVVKDKNGKFVCIEVKGNVVVNFYKDSAFPEYIKFGHIEGSFECSHCHLESMEGFPMQVDGDFTCFNCTKISSLDGIPKTIGRECVIRMCGKQFAEDEIRAKSKVTRNVYCN